MGPSGDLFSLYIVAKTWTRCFGSQREKASQWQLEIVVGGFKDLLGLREEGPSDESS